MRRFRTLCSLLALLIIVFAVPLASAQDDPNFEIGFKPFGAYHAGDIDSVSLHNGALNVEIPLISYPQRGGKLKLDFALRYQNRSAYYDYVCYPDGTCSDKWSWTLGGFSMIDKTALYADAGCRTVNQGTGWNYYCAPSVTESSGARDLLGATSTSSYTYESVNATAIRGVGVIDSATNSLTITSVTDADGTTYNTPTERCYGLFFGSTNGGGNSCTSSREDANGNKITFSGTTGWTDTMGRTIPLPTQSTNPSDAL
jgi:hypothetical protein